MVPILLMHAALFAAAHDEQYMLGLRHYSAGDYQAAIGAFKEAMALNPENPAYHYWLGKSYGELASVSGIFKAYDLSKKVRYHLERAVELDGDNIEALTALLKYYERAPAFLGGGEEKADKIRKHLEQLVREKPDI